jgi:ABC-type lipoprotein export system ATPase subunit
MRDPSTTPLIVAQGLTRIYPLGSTEVIGVENIDLRIAQGELVVLKGNSGSGKSTLLALVGGLDQATRGTLRVANHDLQKATPQELTEYRRKVVGMIFQTFNLLPTLTVMENVCLPAFLAGRPYEDFRKKALEWLEWLNLSSRLSHYPSQLSGGEMQRAAIVRALINEPAVVLADEPTGNLDSGNGRAVIELLAELNRRFGRTILLATHSNLADHCATLRLCLKDGRLTEASDAASDLFPSPA